MNDRELLLKMLDKLRDAISREDWPRLVILSLNMCLKAARLNEEAES